MSNPGTNQNTTQTNSNPGSAIKTYAPPPVRVEQSESRPDLLQFSRETTQPRSAHTIRSRALYLQRTHGNRALGNFLQRAEKSDDDDAQKIAIQRAPTVGARHALHPAQRAEKEDDAQSSTIQRAEKSDDDDAQSSTIQRAEKSDDDDAQKFAIQRAEKSDDDAQSSTAQRAEKSDDDDAQKFVIQRAEKDDDAQKIAIQRAPTVGARHALHPAQRAEKEDDAQSSTIQRAPDVGARHALPPAQSAGNAIQRAEKDEEAQGYLQRTEKEEEAQGRLQRTEKDEEAQGYLQRAEKDEEAQGYLQRAEKDEEAQGHLQRTEKEEEAQGYLQRTEKEEEAQGHLQRAEKDEEAQGYLQRAEKDEEAQGHLQRTEKEEEAQGYLQRAEKDEEAQGHLQRAEKDDDAQKFAIQRATVGARHALHPAQRAAQGKLRVGPADDHYEREADTMASKVLSMPAPDQSGAGESSHAVQSVHAGLKPASSVQRTLAHSITPLRRNRSQRAAADTRYALHFAQRAEKEEEAQAKSSAPPKVSEETESQIAQSRGRGKEMAPETRSDMESRFGADFSGVRIHSGSQGANLSNKMQAHAFTVGNDIYFNNGMYNPDSASGKHLLAHELTHTVQQGASKANPDVSHAGKSAAGAQKTSVQKMSLASQVTPTQRKVQRWSVKGIINKILSFIPGFTLVSVFLGENPVTGDKVPQTGKMLMKGATELIPVLGPILWSELEQSGSTDKAGKWLDKKMKKLGLTIPLIKDLISKAWDSISIWDGIDGNIENVKRVFGPYLGKTVSLIKSIGSKIREFVIEGFLRMAGPMGVQVWNVLRKSPKALKKILDKPVIIFKNFFKGIKLGFDNFGKNFISHFKKSVMEWIFGTMGKAGLQLPKKFDLAGIFSVVMQVLGLTWPQVKERIILALGKMIGPEKAEKAFGYMEKGVDIVQRVIKEGPIALWSMIKEKIGDLKQMVLDKVISWAKTTIIKKAIAKLVSMLNPAGAIFQACMMIYDVVAFFMNNWDRIKAIVSAIFNSLAIAALGQIGKIGKFIEGVLAKGMTLLIAFLARFIGLGGISEQVKNIIDKIRKPIYTALDKVIGVVLKMASPIIKAVAKGAAKVSAAIDKAKEKGKQAITAVKEKGKAVVGKIKGKITPQEKANHEKIANKIIEQMKQGGGDNLDYPQLRQKKLEQAKKLKAKYTPKLKKGIKININFANMSKDKDDGDLDFDVVIAPNTTKKSGSVPLKEIPPNDEIHKEVVKKVQNEGYSKFLLIGRGASAILSDSYVDRSKAFKIKDRKQVDAIGNQTYCHSYGDKTPGTKTGHWIPDHMPPVSLIKGGMSASGLRFYPHSLRAAHDQRYAVIKYKKHMRYRLNKRKNKEWAKGILPGWFHG